MAHDSAHGEPTPFDAVPRNGALDIIQPLSNLDPNPFRDSPDSLAILDALVPGGYLHNALMDLSKAGDFTVLDLMLEMRLGGAQAVVVSTDRLPSPVALEEWTQHGPRQYEYRGIQFEIQIPGDIVYE